VLRARRPLRLGPHPLGWTLGLPASTVHAILRRNGCSRLRERPARGAILRYERERPGELVHVDVKKLGRIVKPSHRVTGDRRDRNRGAGWLYVFAAIDDATRLGFARVYPDESADSALEFLEEAIRFYHRHGITTERVLTDNGTCFKKRWAIACAQQQIAVKKTRPYRPQTNGKAKRFIRTLLEIWAFAYPYAHESDRVSALPGALDSYNRFRRHRALGGQTPLQRVNDLPGTNN
jgi:transposase InsO family protein